MMSGRKRISKRQTAAVLSLRKASMDWQRAESIHSTAAYGGFMKRRKFRRGKRIGTFRKLLRELENNDFVMWQPNRKCGICKALHLGFIMSWQTRLVLMFLRNGAFYEARINKRGLK